MEGDEVLHYISQSQADSTDLEGVPLDATEELAPNLGSISRSGGKKYRTVGRSQGRAHARGKVRGIVENWERSGGESGLGGVDGGVCMMGVLLTRSSFNRHVILGAKILLAGLRAVSLIIIRRPTKHAHF